MHSELCVIMWQGTAVRGGGGGTGGGGGRETQSFLVHSNLCFINFPPKEKSKTCKDKHFVFFQFLNRFWISHILCDLFFKL